MNCKFANKSGLRPPSVAGSLDNYRIPGVLFGLRRNPCRQVSHAHQIVSRGGEGEHPAQPVQASVSGFPEITHGLHPAEDFLQPFAQALADGVVRPSMADFRHWQFWATCGTAFRVRRDRTNSRVS